MTETTWIDEGDTSFDEGHDAGYQAGRLDAADKIASLQQQLKEAREALQDIANQKLFEEMTTEEQDDACFSDGYDMCIETARSFLSKTEKNNG